MSARSDARSPKSKNGYARSTPSCSPSSVSPIRCGRRWKTAAGRVGDWTVMSAQTDPFRMDTDGNHRDGQWFADTMNRLRIVALHNRGLHYAFLGQPKPDGTDYGTADWTWLCGVSNVARWLDYIPFDRITDHKNDAPTLRMHSSGQPKGFVSTDPELVIPDADDLEPYIGVTDFAGMQPYRIALLGEKSSLFDVLDPISRRYNTDLLLPSGDISNTMVYQLAKAAAADGRPLVVIYFSDCDPSGFNMPIVISRKPQAFKVQHFPDLEFRCYQAGLTPHQVKTIRPKLPESPVKETELRGQRWTEKFGVEQTEIDSIATLRPDLLREIAVDMIEKFYDTTLDDRVQQAASEWREEAQQAVDEQDPELAQRGEQVVARLDEIRAEVDQLIDEIRVDADDFDLPELPEIPEADIDEDAQPLGLIDSCWSFEEQTQRLIALRKYDDE